MDMRTAHKLLRIEYVPSRSKEERKAYLEAWTQQQLEKEYALRPRRTRKA